MKEAFPEENATTRVRATGRKYRVYPSHIRRWKRKFDEIDAIEALGDPDDEAIRKLVERNTSNKKQRLTGGGRTTEFSMELVSGLKAYFDARRDDNLSVSVRLLIIEARRLDPEACEALTYSAFRQRIHRLLNRWDVTWRRSTHKAQNTRFASKVIDDFQKYVNEKMIMLDISADNVYNCDQTNVYYSMESPYTWAKKGSESVPMKVSNSNNRVTAMLACSLSGKKLPPFVIYKGSENCTGSIYRELQSREGYPEGVELSVQRKAWMDEGQMIRWIRNVWKPYAVRDNRIVYLIMDECPSHLTSTVRRAFTDCNTEMDFIPGGYTSKLQVLDVGINKPFKNYLTHDFEDWLLRNYYARPQREDVASWVKMHGTELLLRRLRIHGANAWVGVLLITSRNPMILYSGLMKT